MKKRIYISAGLATLIITAWGIFYLNSLLPIITGYPAKYLCSAVFVSGRNPTFVEDVELNFSFIQFVTNEINYQEKSVTSRFLWGHSKAIYRDGFGSTLLHEGNEAGLRNQPFPALSGGKYNQDTLPWPMGNIIPDTQTGIDTSALSAVARKLMNGNHYNGNTFAFLVVHKGIPVAESYKPGFTSRTRFLSWSMAKSFTNAIAGIMVKDGLLDIHSKTGIASWQNDGRGTITVNDLLQMQSGLEWNEEYGNRSDVTMMLYNSGDIANYALNRPLKHRAGTNWMYSSGSTNLVCYLMRKQFNNDDACYSYPVEKLFNKTGMPDAVFETDPTGTLIGSSYLYATARDFARFGLLYLRDGVFNGERILPAGWVEYTSTPASMSRGIYGSCFWLNKNKFYPSAPSDMYSCNGHDGQRIFIIPSKDLVVVVLGYSPKPDHQVNFDLMLGDILRTVEK